MAWPVYLQQRTYWVTAGTAVKCQLQIFGNAMAEVVTSPKHEGG